jgi:uncharacterized protein (DUF4415 family)
MKDSTVKRIEIDQTIRDLWEQRDRGLDDDPDAPQLPPEMWEGATVGSFLNQRSIRVRIDNDVLAWLKAKGNGRPSQINDILRQQMMAEMAVKP